jgi:predicted  nucleic acid-binding Zn-ribbon protein
LHCTAKQSCPHSERFSSTNLVVNVIRKTGKKTLRCRQRRERLQKKEAELQGAKSDRAAAQMEKAALERQVKQVQSQTGRMTKDLEKKVRSILPRA